ncbi:uncharacterized protein LOC107464324 [Arachis duranensis]|uniref:Uncharacterized protein LOC107464324 n=1 Tax=Arachis duranensis TaxID=130453 RepID=A0A6P4BJH1_ARADU|nr:uncharacterized protein LOC107464324 [Arachis duranensis]
MSRSRHARDMDKNMRYFHNLASARRRNNRIDTLVINERLIKNQVRIIKIAVKEFYKGLYHQERSPIVGFRDGLVERISEEDAFALEMLPSPEKVREAVWNCESFKKAPESDSYSMNFIKKCWNEIGSEFTAIVLGFFQSSTLPPDANVTWVALAPKFTVLINGSLSKPFKMERGLRQGDPLSPFLFVLVVDVLHRMIGEVVRNDRISSLLVGRDHIELPHLQFVDDTILFCPPEEEIIKNYRRLLHCFELMSGVAGGNGLGGYIKL